MTMLNRRRFLTLSACALAAPAAAAETPQIWLGQAMGADVTLRVTGADRRQARAFFATAERALRHTETVFSLHRESDLSRLNRDGRLAHPPAALLDLLALSDRLHRATGGAFDPSIQPLWLARAMGRDETAAREAVGWDGVRWSQAEIRLTRPGAGLTLNGIAQGWAADRLAEAARRHDLGDLLIDTGELRAIGPAGWDIGIADPAGQVLRQLRLRDRALATSSPLGTRIGPAGEHAHIMAADLPARWSTVSVTAPSAALADGLSTAACLMTRPALDAALAQLPGCRIEALES